jgi:hypothetical protein
MMSAIAHVINNRYLLNARREGIHTHGTECRHTHPSPTAHYLRGGIARGVLVGRTNRMSGWVPPEVTGPCECHDCDGVMVGGQCTVCNFARACGWCGLIKVNGIYTKKWIRPSRNVSHGLCESCLAELHKEAQAS